MLTQIEFEALLDRYLTGICLPAERQLVERWYQQLGQGEELPLPEAERQAIRATVWSGIETRLAAPEPGKS